MEIGRQEFEALAQIARESQFTPETEWRIEPASYAKMIALAARDPGFADDLANKARVGKAARKVLARYDSSAFAEYVIRTEGEGKPIRQAGFHNEMHALVRARDRVIMWGSPSTGKSLQIAVAWPLWILGRDPNKHVAIIQATDNNAKKTIRSASAYISDPLAPGYAALHEVFPKLVPSKRKDAVWNTHAITVDRTATARDPSYQACGLFGNILGARLDIIILDDILTFANTRSEDQRKKVLDWILTTVLNRLDPVHGRIVFMGNAWHPDDAMHVLADGRLEQDPDEDAESQVIARARPSSWASVRYPLRDEMGKTTWPDKWPQKTLDKQYNGLPPAEAARTFDCVASSDATSRIKRSWMVGCYRPGLAGELSPGVPALMRASRPENDPRAYYCAFDLAFADIEKRGDRCAASTLAVTAEGRVELTSVRSGRWTLDQLLSEIESASMLWEPRYIFVESNSAQRVIGRLMRGELEHLGLKFSADLKRRIVPYETGVTKHHPKWGLEGMGVEMKAGLWDIPCGKHNEVHPEIERWQNEMIHYTPDPKIHTGDRAMAVYMAWDGMRRRLGERGFTLLNVSEATPTQSELHGVPKVPPRAAGESADAHAKRIAAERRARLAKLADELQAAQSRSVWDQLDDFT